VLFYSALVHPPLLHLPPSILLLSFSPSLLLSFSPSLLLSFSPSLLLSFSPSYMPFSVKKRTCGVLKKFLQKEPISLRLEVKNSQIEATTLHFLKILLTCRLKSK
jgi:predicted membrane metal-binding protein